MTGRIWSAKARHIAAALAGLLVFALIFTYTGDADLLYASTGGFGAVLSMYLIAHIFGGDHWRE